MTLLNYIFGITFRVISGNRETQTANQNPSDCNDKFSMKFSCRSACNNCICVKRVRGQGQSTTFESTFRGPRVLRLSVWWVIFCLVYSWNCLFNNSIYVFFPAAVTVVTHHWCLWSQRCFSVPVSRTVGHMENVDCWDPTATCTPPVSARLVRLWHACTHKKTFRLFNSAKQ